MEIRSARPDDAKCLLDIYRPVVEQTAFSFELTPPSLTEFKARIEAYSKSHAWLVAEEDGSALGYAYATPHRAREAYQYSLETSVYVDSNFHSQGIGKMLYLELFTRLNTGPFHKAFAGITLPNEKSIALHKSLGFESIGVFNQVGFKLNKWHDVSWWQRDPE